VHRWPAIAHLNDVMTVAEKIRLTSFASCAG